MLCRTLLSLAFLLPAGLLACQPPPPSPAPPTPRLLTLTWEGEEAREPVVVRASQGERVVLRFLNRSPEPTLFHLHGYDREVEVGPGQEGELALTVQATGRFPITRHPAGEHAEGHEGEEVTVGFLEVLPR